ncbi:MAG: hypothetical protein KGI38_12395 [Thaumarchaeota archaeon]|nr:hypothetical protein [Nitrososphaerota archaeon]
MRNYRSVRELLFQGHEPSAYLKAASKVLVAGFFGVLTGWVLQPFFTTVLGIPYWLAYWPAVMGGFIVNLRTQVSLKNIRMEKKKDV